MPDDPAQPKPRRRWLRWLLPLVFGMVAGGLFYLTRPATLAALILPRASEAIGGEVTASRVALGGLNSVVLEDLRIRAPRWEGRAGELVYANRMEVRFALLPLLVGEIRLKSVQADRLELRMAEAADQPGNFSFLALEPKPSDDDDTGAPPRPGEISIEELVIENGVVARGEYRRLGDLRFRGTLTPAASSDSAFTFKLSGRPDAEGRLSIAGIAGSFDPESRAISLAVEDLAIDGRQLAVAPVAVRTWTSRLGLEGRVARAEFEYAPDREPSALIDLRGLAMNLPIDALSGQSAADTWGGFARGQAVDLRASPRMTVRSGTLRLSRNEVRFESIRGELGADADPRVLPVPFEGAIGMRLPTESLPPFEWDARDAWFESAARIAPFSIELAIRGFASPDEGEDRPDTLFLPRAVTKILSDFNITSWTIDVETRLERGAPGADGAAAPLASSGTLRLSRGSGAFEEFPYRLEDVSGVFRYENDRLRVEQLTGKGAEGSSVLIEGRLDGLSTGAEIDLAIRCEDAPIDERLFNSFEEAPREAIGLLFDARASGTLAAAGLLPDAGALVSQRQELARLPDTEENAATRTRLQRSLDAGPFALGGRCGFDMRVYSPAGFGQPVFVTGDVRVRGAGLVFGRFPYPLRLREGAFRVLDESIEILGDGIRAITPAGGEFTVSGRVDIPRLGEGERGVRPLIRIEDKGDALNPALLAAIPHAGDEMPSGWPGADLAPAGELLASLGLEGSVDLRGVVDSDEAGRERFAFTVDFTDGLASPSESGRAQLAELGLPWPPEFTLTECSAQLELTPERVTIAACEGRNGEGSIVATGFADLEGPDRDISLEMRGVPISRAFESYLAQDPEEAARRFARYAPTGAIDGRIRREVRADRATTSGALTPQWLELTLDGSRVRAERIAGRIAVSESGLRAESLEYRLSEVDADDGILRISGPLSDAGGAAGSGDAPLDATITSGRVESPLVRELLASRAKGVLDLLRARAATGRFDAHYASGEREGFSIRPRTLAIGQPGERIECSFAESDVIEGAGDKVRFDLRAALAGTHAGTITASGDYTSNGDNRIAASLRIEASALTPALRKQLPPPLDGASETIRLATKGAFLLDLPDIALRWPASGSAENPDIYQLRGSAALAGASFESGTTFADIDAELPLRFRYEPRAAKPVDFTATLAIARGRVFDRPVGTTEVGITTGAAGTSLELAGAGDIAFGRYDIASTVDFERDAYTARVRIADADYDVLRSGQPLTAETPRSDSRISGTLDFAGTVGAGEQGRTGSGRMSIRNATLASLPVAMRVLQITQLMLPVSSTISAANATFTMQGNRADITSCQLAAGTIQLEGTGTLDIPTFGIGLRLFPRGTVPIVSDVIGGVTNQFFAIDVSGTLADPKASLAPLPGITDMPTPPADAPTAPPSQEPADAPPAPPQP